MYSFIFFSKNHLAQLESYVHQSLIDQEKEDLEKYQDMSLEEIQRQSALQVLYQQTAKTRQARAAAAREEASAAKEEEMAKYYAVKRISFEKNFLKAPPNQQKDPAPK